MATKLEWEGRPIVMADYSIRQGDAVLDLIRDNPQEGSFLCFMSAARWADTNEPVFQSLEEIWQLPFRLKQRVMQLATVAAAANGLMGDDAPPQGEDREERIGPSH